MQDRRVRLGVVGVGIWGRMHIRAYVQHPSAELVGICDLDESRAKKVAAEFGVPNCYGNFDDLLSAGLYGLSVATPDAAHADIAVRAAERGVHMLVEKPLATSLGECERMIAAAAENDMFLMVDWHNRWNPPCVHAWNAICNDGLGEVRYIYYRLPDTIYVPTRMLPWAGESSVMPFLGSHALDTTCWLKGRAPTRVYCKRQEGVLTGMGIDTADMYVTMLDFTGGATAVIERAFAKYTPGTFGGFPDAAYADMFITPEVHGRQVGFAVESIYHFVDCIRDGKRPLTSGEDGLLNMRLILAAEESAREGRPVGL